MHRELAALTERLARVYGDRLVSVILYGSAAAGDYHGPYSDLNVLCVLNAVTPRELSDSEPVFRWWRDAGYSAPLLMSEEEVRTSADCFPIEFHDMTDRRKVLFGRDAIAGTAVDRKYWRAQIEYQLRSRLLRLRQQATAALADRDALLKLCVDSVSTFLVLGRHALLYSGSANPESKREVVVKLEQALNQPLPAWQALLDVRERKLPPQDADAQGLFAKHLNHVEALVAFVDRLEERAEA